MVLRLPNVWMSLTFLSVLQLWQWTLRKEAMCRKERNGNSQSNRQGLKFWHTVLNCSTGTELYNSVIHLHTLELLPICKSLYTIFRLNHIYILYMRNAVIILCICLYRVHHSHWKLKYITCILNMTIIHTNHKHVCMYFCI